MDAANLMPNTASADNEHIDISIVICTRNRSGDLQQCLKHLARVAIPTGRRVELVIVDNGSSDDTRAAVETARLPNMAVRYVHEPKPGKAHAFGAGLAAARGSVFLMTDDDTHVPVDWVERMCSQILAGEAGAVQGGVTIAPHLERPWLKGLLRIWVAEVADPLHRPEGLVGANMAISRAAMASAGPLDANLGPGAAGFYEDTVLGWAIEAAGERIEYRPEVAVEHHFDPARLSLGAFLDLARRMARSRAHVVALAPHALPTPKLSDVFRNLPGLVLRGCTQAVRYLIAREPDAGFVYYYYQLCLWRAFRARAAQPT